MKERDEKDLNELEAAVELEERCELEGPVSVIPFEKRSESVPVRF